MSDINAVIESLSPEELDLLNSDPEMLAAFKAKYAAPPASLGSQIVGDALKEAAKSPLDRLKELDPAHILPMAGAAAVNAPGAASALIGALPGIGNPADILPGLVDLKEHPEQLGKAVVRANDIGQGQAPTDEESTAVNAGKAAGTVMDLAMPGDEGGVLADKLKGWSQQAARNAIGFVKSLANKGDVDDLPAIADFVMNPVKIGNNTLPPILTASSTPREMLANADNVLKAAGPKLGQVSDAMDTAVNANPDLIDLEKIEGSLEKLKKTVEDNAKELGAPVVAQYEKAINDFLNVATNPSAKPNLFTALRQFKTTVGELMGEGDNVVPSKSALQKVYGILASELDDAANSVGKDIGQAYSEANNAYTYALDAVTALKGKIRGEETRQLAPSIKDLFTRPVPINPASMASALGWASKNVPPAISAASRALPGALSGLYSGLTAGQQ